MIVTLTYSLTRHEFMGAARTLWSYDGIGGRGNWITAALVAALGVTLLLFDFATGWIWIGAAGLLTCFTLLRPILWRRGFDRSTKYSAPITATFAPDQIETTSAEGTSALSWSTFDAYAETDDFIFLFLGKRNFSVIPKRAAHLQDLDMLTNLIAAKLPKKRKRWL